jgi:hypothetical protein
MRCVGHHTPFATLLQGQCMRGQGNRIGICELNPGCVERSPTRRRGRASADHGAAPDVMPQDGYCDLVLAGEGFYSADAMAVAINGLDRSRLTVPRCVFGANLFWVLREPILGLIQ